MLRVREPKENLSLTAGDGEEAEARVQGDGRPLVRLRRHPARACHPLPCRRLLRGPLAPGRGLQWNFTVRAHIPSLSDVQRWHRFRQRGGQLAVQAGRQHY